MAVTELHEKRCYQTGKVAHRLRGDAILAMLETYAREKRGDARGKIYRCSDCGWWHWGHRGYPINRSIHEP